MKIKNNSHNFKKSLGQNFLEDKEILENIKDRCNLDKSKIVIEIGVGQGFLTNMLIDNFKKVIAFEIDDDLIPYLKNKFSKYQNFTLNHTDFLKYDLNNLNKKEKYVVIANIPYYITTPIIEKLLEFSENIDEIYIMVQKEVANRLTAKKCSKDMGLLTHFVNFFAETTYLFTVEKEKFTPIPKVDSAFIKLELRKDKKYENLIDYNKYSSYLKKAFSNKRKTLVNNLSSIIDKEKLKSILLDMNLSEKTRAEELNIEDFIELIQRIENR